jgi:hypothetical protein
MCSMVTRKKEGKTPGETVQMVRMEQTWHADGSRCCYTVPAIVAVARMHDAMLHVHVITTPAYEMLTGLHLLIPCLQTVR